MLLQRQGCRALRRSGFVFELGAMLPSAELSRLSDGVDPESGSGEFEIGVRGLRVRARLGEIGLHSLIVSHEIVHEPGAQRLGDARRLRAQKRHLVTSPLKLSSRSESLLSTPLSGA